MVLKEDKKQRFSIWKGVVQFTDMCVQTEPKREFSLQSAVTLINLEII